MSKGKSAIIDGMRAAHRKQFSMLQPDDVLKHSRGVVKMLLDLKKIHNERRISRALVDVHFPPVTPLPTTEADAVFAALELLEGAGYFDVDGALSRCEQTQPCRTCKAYFERMR